MAELESVAYTITADGTYTFSARGPDTDITVDGTWGGGTMSLQKVGKGGTGVELPGGSYTANFTTVFEANPSSVMQVVLTGATTPNLRVDVAPVRRR
jgi:hypothetical protein